MFDFIVSSLALNVFLKLNCVDDRVKSFYVSIHRGSV